jgi:hypothetical protein
MPDLVGPATPWLMRSALWAGIGALVASTLVLWIHYGGAVFFEMIATGLASCF